MISRRLAACMDVPRQSGKKEQIASVWPSSETARAKELNKRAAIRPLGCNSLVDNERWYFATVTHATQPLGLSSALRYPLKLGQLQCP
jgi:hypothetical protein